MVVDKVLFIVIPDLIRDPEGFLTPRIFAMSLARVKTPA